MNLEKENKKLPKGGLGPEQTAISGRNRKSSPPPPNRLVKRVGEIGKKNKKGAPGALAEGPVGLGRKSKRSRAEKRGGKRSSS